MRGVLVSAYVLFACATGCRPGAPLPMPDALRSDGLKLTVGPPSLVVRPGSAGRIQFQLLDDQNQPISDYPIAYSIVPEPDYSSDVPARLSTDVSLTDQHGTTELEVLADQASPDAGDTAFFVQGTAPGADPAAPVEVRVTVNPYSVQIFPVAAIEFISTSTIAKSRLLFYDDLTCDQLDLVNLSAAPIRPRWSPDVDPGSSRIFTGVSGKDTDAVVGLGLDSNNVVRVAGCLDLLGGSLVEDQTMSATLVMDHLFPILTGNYLVTSDITLAPPVLPDVVAIQAAWQEWSRCPVDPARLWLDCTIDALAAGTGDPNDCVPVPGGEGPLGSQLEPLRGVVVPALGSAVVSDASTAPCRDAVDSSGNPSLEAVVRGLFDGARGSLSDLKVEAFPSEIATLLASFRIDSTMNIMPDVALNNYLVDHDLVDIAFPTAVGPSPVLLSMTALGARGSDATGIEATVRNGIFTLPAHGFALRLGSDARYAFEGSSLKTRGVSSATALVDAIVGMATISDGDKSLSGCDAMDATLCDRLTAPRGCLLGACRAGLTALAQKLEGAFTRLDGGGLDFFLLGSAAVIDLTNDGQADALGTPKGATLSAGPGQWAAEIRAQRGTSRVVGTWSATRAMATSP